MVHFYVSGVQNPWLPLKEMGRTSVEPDEEPQPSEPLTILYRSRNRRNRLLFAAGFNYDS